MTKRLQHELTYDAPLAEVAAMLRDPAFREKVCERQRVISHDVTVTADGDAADVTVERVQAVTGVPAVAAKVVGDQITIVHREAWRDLTAGDYTVGIPGKPGQISGTVSLREAGGRTVETVDLEVTVSIPLVGGKLEGVVVDLLKAALRTEHEVGVKHLA
ncbi:DUF2505 domain-containing protein [Nocardioides daphniae]|uniref:DUF2505 domain-containing protein n=1 Tax=Nocardioides daphniae TaxID=402297 RepID=A0A4P7U969_9ACTN|nr:DUF2505 domain-containing protein [Nocardioides daphniae]QCC76693.1 DUF2505 domain-containing protein [Nocardioides daphniae]GGD15397.1 hypothetical protein GCM10007231_13000 [Nocardioides daphniae]